ncbi:MAG TPA: RDD family protein [Patescibacteria group bacterium]
MNILFKRFISLFIDLVTIWFLNLLFYISIATFIDVSVAEKLVCNKEKCWPASTLLEWLLYFYFIMVSLLWNGKTVGSKVMNLSIISLRGKITTTQLILRQLSFVVFFFIFPSIIAYNYWFLGSLFLSLLVGTYLIIMLVTPNKLLPHEIISKTKLIKMINSTNPLHSFTNE